LNLDVFKIWEIETTFPVEKIKLNNVEIWPVLRELLVVHFFYNQWPVKTGNNAFSPVFKRLSSIRFGLCNLFKPASVICFSVDEKQTLLNGKYEDRYLGGFLKTLKNEALQIEFLTDGHPSIKNRQHKKVISFSLFNSLAYMLSLVCSLFITIKGQALINEICNTYGITDSKKKGLLKKIIHFECRTVLFKWFYKLKKTSLVACVCHYQVLPEIRAAKELGIKVIEFQHGVVDKFHISFMKKKECSAVYLPDEFLVFGESVKNEFVADIKFVPSKNIHVVGNYFINENSKPSDTNINLNSIAKKYEKLMVVTSVNNVEKEMIEFTKEAARLNDRIGYIYIPRETTATVKQWVSTNKVNNVHLIESGETFYDCMKVADFHSTTYSTTAIEAPSLGVSNITMVLKDYKNTQDPRERFDHIVPSSVNKYAETPEEFVHLIETTEVAERSLVMKENTKNYCSDYENNLEQHLNSIQIEDLFKKIATLSPETREWTKGKYFLDTPMYSEFLINITKKTKQDFQDYLNDFINDKNFKNCFMPSLKEMEDSMENTGDLRFHSLTMYFLVRALKPKLMIETGVAQGKSSSMILLAMHHNKVGKLMSIDLPNYEGKDLADGAKTSTGKKEVGWLVPDFLRERWALHLGDAKVELPKVLSEIDQAVDVFFHDSLHTVEHVLFELNTVFPQLAENGLILVDDCDSYPKIAVDEFIKEKKKTVIQCHDLAGVI
jgi:predicted O-methyltransferase YrrM